MGTLLEPLLWRNVRQTHTSPTITNNEVDLSLVANFVVAILKYEVIVENPITQDGIVVGGLSVDPNVTPTSLALFGADDDTVAMFPFEAEFTTSGMASQLGYAMVDFPEPGLIIADNPSVHLITVGTAVTQALLHRIWYKYLRLSDVEAAGIIIRRRRQ